MARDYPFPFWHFPRPPWAKPVRGITHYLISRKLETIEDTYHPLVTNPMTPEERRRFQGYDKALPLTTLAALRTFVPGPVPKVLLMTK